MSCNGCRVLRRGCSDSCLLRSCLTVIDGAEAQGHATLFLAKFFGRAGLMGFISAVEESQRGALFQSLLYEACGRTINPVYGCAGLLWCGQWNVCEAAVHAVLRGESLKKVSSTASMPFLSLNSTSFTPASAYVPNLGFNPSMLFYSAAHNSPAPYWTPTGQPALSQQQPSCSVVSVDNRASIPSSGHIPVLPSLMSHSFPNPLVRMHTPATDASYWKNCKTVFPDYTWNGQSQNRSNSPTSCSDSPVLSSRTSDLNSNSNSSVNSPVGDSSFNGPPGLNGSHNAASGGESCGKRALSSGENSCTTAVDHPSARANASGGCSSDSPSDKAPLVAPVARRLKPNSDSTSFMSGLTPKGKNAFENSIEFHHLFPTHPGAKATGSFSGDFLHPSHGGEFSIALLTNHPGADNVGRDFNNVWCV